MKTTGIKVLTILTGLIIGNTVKAQKSSGITTETYKVSGNCGMCKKTIEAAAKGKGVQSAEWSESGKILTVKYDKRKTTQNQLLRSVAYAGYDNEKYLAPDLAYTKLHSCCQYDRVLKPVASASKHANHEARLNTTETKNIQSSESGIKEVYNQYFALKDALIKSDGSATSNAANTMLSALEKVEMGAFTEKEHNSYMKLLSGMKEHAKIIAQIKNLEKQRATFSKLSDLIRDLMKTIHPGYEVYVDHCPMFNDGKGANWLSKEKAIRNPYYGSKMMTCGNLTETLK